MPIDVKLSGLAAILIVMALGAGGCASTSAPGVQSAAADTAPEDAAPVLRRSGETARFKADGEFAFTVSETARIPASVRGDYDTDLLELPSATHGALLTASHTLAHHSPEAGRLNVAAYPEDEVTAFSGASGAVFNLSFRVKAVAPAGSTPITFIAGFCSFR